MGWVLVPTGDRGQWEHVGVAECVSGAREGVSVEATFQKTFDSRWKGAFPRGNAIQTHRSMLTGHVEGTASGQDISSLRCEYRCE